MGNLPEDRRTKVKGSKSQAEATPSTNPTAVLFSRLQKGSMGQLFAWVLMVRPLIVLISVLGMSTGYWTANAERSLRGPLL